MCKIINLICNLFVVVNKYSKEWISCKVFYDCLHGFICVRIHWEILEKFTVFSFTVTAVLIFMNDYMFRGDQ